jgi:hypothetical protein
VPTRRSNGSSASHCGGGFAIALLAFIGVVGQLYVVVACAGILMIPLGLLVALDVHGVADRLGARRMGFALSGRSNVMPTGAFRAPVSL